LNTIQLRKSDFHEPLRLLKLDRNVQMEVARLVPGKSHLTFRQRDTTQPKLLLGRAVVSVIPICSD